MDDKKDSLSQRMKRVRIELSDGRYLIYYTFDEEPAETSAAGELVSSPPAE